MSFIELRDPAASAFGGRVFILEIAGAGTGDHGVRYYSGPAPATKTDAGSAQDFADIEAIVSVSAISGRIDGTAAIADYAPVTVALARNKLRGGIYDPGTVLRRVSHRHGAFARLVTTLEADDSAGQVVYLDRDPALLGSFPGHIAIGRESMWATAAAGDGSGGNPWRLTGVTRAIRGTIPLTHYVGNDDAAKPFVKREVTAWRNRRAIIYAAFVRADGTVGSYAEVMRGFLRDAPHLDGDRVQVSMVPMVGVLDRRIGGDGRRVGLHPRRHCIEGSAAAIFQHAQLFAPRDAFVTTANGNTAAGADPIVVHHTTGHESIFDVSLGADHPRAGPVRFTTRRSADGSWTRTPVGYVGGFEMADPAQTPGIDNGTAVYNDRAIEVKSAKLIDPAEAGNADVLTWPDDYLDAIHAAWAPGSILGVDGAWADVSVVVDDAQRGPSLRVTYNAGSLDVMSPVGPLHLLFWAGESASWPSDWGSRPLDWASGVGVPFADMPEALHYPIRLADPDDTRDLHWNGNGYWVNGWSRFVRVDGPTSEAYHYLPITVCRGGWYQQGERYITTDGEVVLTTAGDAWVRIEYTDPLDGERKVQRARIIAVTEPEADVWRLELDRASRLSTRSFGDWGGGDAAVITPDVHMRPQPIADALLRLLFSIGGRGVGTNGRDSLPFGAELIATDVDLPSFLAIQAPPALQTWAPILPPEGAVLSDIIEPVLKACGYALVMRTDEQGRCRVAAVPMGAPTAVDATSGTLTDARWDIDAMPDGAVDSAVINKRTFKTDHAEEGEGEAQLVLTTTDNGSVGAYGAGGAETIEIRGLRLRDGGVPQALATILSIDARRGVLTGYARAQWRARTTTADGWLLHPGAVVTVTSEHLSGFDDEVGVTAALARVQEVTLQVDGDGCDLVLTYYGNRSTGWNLALKVTASTAADKLTVAAAGTWAPAEHPVTGEALDPLDYLVVGHLVDVVPWGDHDSRVQLTVSAINTATRVITLSGAHGMASPNWGRIVWTDYDDAPTVAHGFAYLADDNDTLGAAADDGFELV